MLNVCLFVFVLWSVQFESFYILIFFSFFCHNVFTDNQKKITRKKKEKLEKNKMSQKTERMTEKLNSFRFFRVS